MASAYHIGQCLTMPVLQVRVGNIFMSKSDPAKVTLFLQPHNVSVTVQEKDSKKINKFRGVGQAAVRSVSIVGEGWNFSIQNSSVL